jgi:Na+-transporting methylmalonyl-CoA/oxaloacetate decarboxylase gamma subunit
MEKYGVQLMMFAFLIVLILGMWFIVGKIGDAVAPLGAAAEQSVKIQEANAGITNTLSNIVSKLGIPDSSGLKPA